MKLARVLIKSFFAVFLILSIIVFAGVFYLQTTLADEYKIKKGEDLSIKSPVPIVASFDGAALSDAASRKSVGDSFSVDLKAFGIIPISKIDVEVVDELYVAVLGTPFGMKIYTKGVMVTSLSDVQTEKGVERPAKKAGIKLGDYILSINGQAVTTNEDVSSIVEASNGKKLKFEIMRNNTKIYISFCAVKSKETGSYKIGLWVKDSSAGIGTLTFYSPATDIVCGLGHGICEEETGELLVLQRGIIVNAEIISAEKGEVGAPGKLNGRMGYATIGEIENNCQMGVYSRLTGNLTFSKLTEIALKQEVKNGKAQILCTLDGNTPQLYDCIIEVRSSAYHSKVQNLLITVTDEKLLNKTGGIVQGMSGSPILQNGKLIGAVTHVLIDDPQKGYGIFAENMLETAQLVADQQKLKDAS
ncbi:MAG: SpoIVB peptidase [Clostridia bacterium]|nr:SpoIVB peptidase [Clostridia bacterium]